MRTEIYIKIALMAELFIQNQIHEDRVSDFSGIFNFIQVYLYELFHYFLNSQFQLNYLTTHL